MLDALSRRMNSPSLRLHINEMVGPPRFELGSDGPQPPSIGQANPRARETNHSLGALNGATSWIKSKCPIYILRQQYLENPTWSRASETSVPEATFSLNSSHLWAITAPQLKHLTGIIMIYTSSVGLLFLSASTASKLVLWLFSSRVIDQQTSIESKIFISQIFIMTLSSSIVED